MKKQKYHALHVGLLEAPLLIFDPNMALGLGAVHKVRHARGGGGRRRCDSL